MFRNLFSQIKKMLRNPSFVKYIIVLLFFFILYKIKNHENSNPAEVTNAQSSVQVTRKKPGLLQDMSDPFHKFPRVVPYECVNVTARFVNLFE
jgi:hypothetical protein